MGARVVHAMEDVPFFFLCPDTAGHAYKSMVYGFAGYSQLQSRVDAVEWRSGVFARSLLTAAESSAPFSPPFSLFCIGCRWLIRLRNTCSKCSVHQLSRSSIRM
jgi:hypothetical protein